MIESTTLDGQVAIQQRGAAAVYAWYVCVVLMLILACGYMDRSVISIIVIPMEHALGMSDTQIGLLQGAAFSTPYILLLFPLARLADRGNRRNLLLAGTIVWCSSTISCGLSQTIPMLFVSRIGVAIGEATVMPCTVSILSDYFSPHRRTRALSLLAIGGYLGSALALIGGGALVHALGEPAGRLSRMAGQLEPWRALFVVAGAVGFTLVPLLLMVKEPPRSGFDTRREKPASVREVAAEINRRRTAFAAVILGFALISMAGQTWQAWSPTLLARVHGWNIRQAGTSLGLLALTLGPLGAVLGANMADVLARRGHVDSKLIVSFIGSSICTGAGFAVLDPQVAIVLGAAAVLSFFVGVSFGLAQASIIEIAPANMRAQTTAIYALANNLLSAAAGPLMVGILNDHLFHDPMRIGTSVALVLGAAFTASVGLLWMGRRPFKAIVSDASKV